MALIYPTIWEQGNERKQLTPGYHYKQTVKSLVVPEGQVVTIYKNEDRRGEKSLPFHEGTYHHLYFYGISEKPGVVHVEENGLKSLDLITVGWDVAYDPKTTRARNSRCATRCRLVIGSTAKTSLTTRSTGLSFLLG